LQARGLMQRKVAPQDRRVRLLHVTAEGKALLAQLAPEVLRTQQRILAPLDAPEQAEFLRLLKRLVEANNDASRAPRSLDV
jgi:DNA-binding MarR family transcriptional regulator